MKHSIKKQMIVIFISLLAFMCVAVLACNVWLLGPYYIHNKEAKFISMYEALLDAEQNDEMCIRDRVHPFMNSCSISKSIVCR